MSSESLSSVKLLFQYLLYIFTNFVNFIFLEKYIGNFLSSFITFRISLSLTLLCIKLLTLLKLILISSFLILF